MVKQAGTPMAEVNTVYDLANGNLYMEQFLREGLARALSFHVHEHWDVEVPTLDDVCAQLGGEQLCDHRWKDHEVIVLDLPNSVTRLELRRHAESNSTVWATVSAGARQTAVQEMARLKELLPEARRVESEQITVQFWFRSGQGARSVTRRLIAPTWAEALHNYPAPTRAALSGMMSDYSQVISGGRLL